MIPVKKGWLGIYWLSIDQKKLKILLLNPRLLLLKLLKLNIQLQGLKMSDMFEGLIGQENVKKKLSFYLKAFNKTRFVLLNFVGAKGLGKTEFAKAFARNLTNNDGSPRPLLRLIALLLKIINLSLSKYSYL